ncbi:MAG: F0F1 ATP synthase subunit B [Planctomycetes bacterium]|nr:F0F1 ATP synthase subunit B [Planctomycetota bacterium]
MTATIRNLLAALLLAIPFSAALAQHETPPAAPEAEQAVSEARQAVTEAAKDAAASEHPAPHGAHEEEQPSLLAPDFGSAAWTIVLFVVLLVVLRAAAWKPILGGLQSRENKIKGDLEQAEKASRDAAAKLAELQAKLSGAEAEAQRIMDQSRKEAEKLALKVQADTRQELDAMKKQAQADIRFAKEQALNEIYAQAAMLSTTVAGKILGRAINADDQKTLVEQAVSEMTKARNN